MRDNILEILKEELELLEKSANVLSISSVKCNEITIRVNFSPDELEKFEAFCSRFARTSDITIQRIFRLIDEIDLEEPGSVRDSINRAGKKGIVRNPEKIIVAREIRNKIVHTYEPHKLNELFKGVLDNAPYLLAAVKDVKEFCQRKYFSTPGSD